MDNVLWPSAATMDDLPEELHLHISAFLAPKELGRLGCCSAQHRRLCADSALWEPLAQARWAGKQRMALRRFDPALHSLNNRKQLDPAAQLAEADEEAEELDQGVWGVDHLSSAAGLALLPPEGSAERRRTVWRARFRAAEVEAASTVLAEETVCGLRWAFRFRHSPTEYNNERENIQLPLFELAATRPGTSRAATTAERLAKTRGGVHSCAAEERQTGGTLSMPTSGYPRMRWRMNPRGEFRDFVAGTSILVENFPAHIIERTSDWGWTATNEHVQFFSFEGESPEAALALREQADAVDLAHNDYDDDPEGTDFTEAAAAMATGGAADAITLLNRIIVSLTGGAVGGAQAPPPPADDDT